jgi:GntR family transcriptional regulator
MANHDQARPAGLFKIDHRSKLPRYEQIARNLRELILNGDLRTGEAVPSEWELADLYGVSRLTVRRAIDDLARQNWLNRRHGVGTFVSKPLVASIAPSKLSFTEQMRAIGRTPGSRLVCSQTEPASPRVALSLGIPEGEPAIKITRVRLADEIPILLETSYLHRQRFPELAGATSLEGGSLYEHLRVHYGVVISRMDQTLQPVLLREAQAGWLADEPGAPSILSKIVAYNSDGEPIEYSESFSSSNHSEFYFSFQRGEVGD